MKENEKLTELQDTEAQMDDLQNAYCTCECVVYDNGGWCPDDCPILEIVGELYAKSNKIIKEI